MAHAGQTFGRYRIGEIIGAGGMGVVYRAYDEKLQREVAIKVMAAGTLDNDAARKRFRNEARVLSQLNHPAIQTIHDFESFEGVDLLISELLSGVSEASIWLHDDKGDRQVTFEGFAFQATLSPDGKRLYYLRRSAGSRSFLSGELYAADVATARSQRLLPGLILSHYSLSHDGKQIVAVPEVGGEKTGLFLADATGMEPPRQISTNAAQRAFFGRPGEIIYESGRRVMRVNEDGTDDRLANNRPIIQIMRKTGQCSGFG